MNPIGHYLHGADDEFKQYFDDFKANHNASYPTKLHEMERERVFRNNLRMIAVTNRQQRNYKLAVNHLADRTPEELKVLRGRLQSKGYNGGQAFSSSMKTGDLPPYIDWRLAGAVTPVRDQAICGSCWAFGTIGTIVGVNFVKTGKLSQFSEQQLVDCSWNEGNNGCDGGEDFRVYNYIQKVGGLALDEDYGNYLGNASI
jgi:C1A family cysteine protease